MVISKKMLKWANKNIESFEGKTVFVTGATGSLGECACRYFLHLGANLIVSGRNQSKTENLAKSLENDFGKKIPFFIIDYSDTMSIDTALSKLQEAQIDVFVCNAGIYRQKVKMINDFDITYLVDSLSYYYFVTKLIKQEKHQHTRVVATGSVGYTFSKINFGDFQGLKTSRIKRYGLAKRTMMASLLNLKDQTGADIVIAHPGVSGTNLFSAKNKAYAKIFDILILPLMKIIFMNPQKASLSIVLAASGIEVPSNRWVGPKGFLHCWGLPGVTKLRKSILIEKEKAEKIQKENILKLNKK